MNIQIEKPDDPADAIPVTGIQTRMKRAHHAKEMTIEKRIEAKKNTLKPIKKLQYT